MRQIKEFMTLVGRKRFIMLVIMLGLAGGLAALWQKYLLPQNQILTGERASIEGERNRLQQEILELPAKYQKLKENESTYNTLKEKGLMLDQDRIEARSRLDRLRTIAGLRGIQYNIEPQEIVTHSNDYAMYYDVIRSRITVGFKGLTDIEMRDFIEKMNTDFSGLVLLKSAEFERDAALTPENLMQLSMKTPVDFVIGKAAFEWYSVIEKPKDATTPQTQAFGGLPQ